MAKSAVPWQVTLGRCHHYSDSWLSLSLSLSLSLFLSLSLSLHPVSFFSLMVSTPALL